MGNSWETEPLTGDLLKWDASLGDLAARSEGKKYAKGIPLREASGLATALHPGRGGKQQQPAAVPLIQPKPAAPVGAEPRKSVPSLSGLSSC